MLKYMTVKTRHWWAKLKSTDAWAYHHLGKTHLQFQNWQAAVEACQQAIRLNPQCPWFYDSLGKAYAGQDLWQEAIAAFQQAIERDPNLSWLHYELGRCLAKQGDWNAAVPALQRSIELKPDFVWAYHALGEVRLDQDQPEAAIELYQQAIQLSPHQPLFHQKLDYAQHSQAQRPMTLDILLKHLPKLHQVFGKSASLGVSEELLHFLDRQVSSQTHTLETGAGISTLLFALKGASHTCIVPDAGLIDRIQSYCQRHQISTETLTFHLERSEVVLPQLQLQLDLVLIDGRHAFPSPFIDWYYSSNCLKVGGITIIDDTQLWTGEILKDFLKLESEWEFIEELPHDSPNSAIFRKLQEGSHTKWWLQQPYAMQQSPRSIERIPK